MTHTARAAGALALGAIAALALARPVSADVERSSGATVYVPVYSQAFHASNARPFQIAISVSVRNTDPKQSIRLLRADYHDAKGKKVRGYVTTPIDLGPLESHELHVGQDDGAGGAGATFIVAWESREPVNEPLIESIMIGTAAGQGISFTSRGQRIE